MKETKKAKVQMNLNSSKREPSEPLPEGETQSTKKGESPVIQQKEVGGPKGPEPTRYGDWERKGIASDF